MTPEEDRDLSPLGIGRWAQQHRPSVLIPVTGCHRSATRNHLHRANRQRSSRAAAKVWYPHVRKRHWGECWVDWP